MDDVWTTPVLVFVLLALLAVMALLSYLLMGVGKALEALVSGMDHMGPEDTDSLVLQELRRIRLDMDTQPADCDKGPTGWQCTRTFGHEGPCALEPLQKNKGAAIARVPYRMGDEKAIAICEAAFQRSVYRQGRHAIDTLEPWVLEAVKDAYEMPF